MVRLDFSGLLKRWSDGEVRQLAACFAAAGGRRITLSDDSARLVAQALRTYADILAAPRDERMGANHLIEVRRDGGATLTVATASHTGVALAAFEGALKKYPGYTVVLRQGFNLMREEIAPSGGLNETQLGMPILL